MEDYSDYEVPVISTYLERVRSGNGERLLDRFRNRITGARKVGAGKRELMVILVEDIEEAIENCQHLEEANDEAHRRRVDDATRQAAMAGGSIGGAGAALATRDQDKRERNASIGSAVGAFALGTAGGYIANRTRDPKHAVVERHTAELRKVLSEARHAM